MTRLLSVITSLVVLAGLAACGPSGDDDTPTPHVQRSGPVGPVPDGLKRFYAQELAWDACDPYATTSLDEQAFQNEDIECARVEVPVDYTRPQGETLSFGLLRKPAEDPSRRIGSLLVNPGGPGASGMSSAAGLATSVQGNELGQRFDLVGFDPRGVGSSEPKIECLSGAQRDAERLDADADASPQGVQRNEQENRDYAAECARRSGEDLLANVGTREVVKDMDVIRSALGDRKLTYLGYSYGTRIGSEYGEQFPGNVRAMVLDGAMDPGQSAIDAMVSQGEGFQRAFEDFASWCAEQQQCALGDDPDDAVRAYQELTRPLVEQPVEAGNGRKLSFSDATTATIQALYGPQLWPQLNTGLAELQRGNGRILLGLADVYFGREPDGEYSNVTDAFDAVHCVDDQRVMARSKMREVDQRYRDAAPFLDNGYEANPAREACAFWPVPVTGDPDLPNVRGLPPTLVISSTGDPATPYRAGVELASALGGGLLTFEGTQHTVFLQGNKCIDNAGIQYLVNLQLPEDGARCEG